MMEQIYIMKIRNMPIVHHKIRKIYKKNANFIQILAT